MLVNVYVRGVVGFKFFRVFKGIFFSFEFMLNWIYLKVILFFGNVFLRGIESFSVRIRERILLYLYLNIKLLWNCLFCDFNFMFL